MKIKALPAKRITIGVLISYFDGLYQYQIWKAINDFAEENDISLVFLAGKIFDSPFEFDSQFNIVYQLSDLKHFDGLFIASSSIAVLSKVKELEKFIRPYRKIPMVSLSMPLSGIPSVLIDNKNGMKDVIVHLIKVHKCRKIAFIRGPSSNDEAEERFTVYRETLSEYNLEYNPGLVVSGDFTGQSGKKCAEKLLEEGKSDFDALVVSNDVMAFEAVYVLKSNGFSVPGDIPVTGFDDIPQSQYLSPPLTTVAQPLNDQSCIAMKRLVDKILGKPVPAITKLPARIIIRESCGCMNISDQVHYRGKNRKKICFDFYDDKDNSRMKKKLIGTILETAGLFNIGIKIKNELIFTGLLKDLEADIMDEKSNRFIGNWNSLLKEKASFEDRADFWTQILFHINDFYKPLMKSKKMLLHFESIIKEAQIQTCKQISQITANHSTKMDILFLALRNIIQSLNSAFSKERILDIILESFPATGINECFILLYDREITEKEGSRFLPESARLVLSFNQNGIKVKDPNSPLVQTRKIISDNIDIYGKRGTWIIMPLLDKDIDFGLIVFGLNRKEAIIYETLRAEISNSLLRAKLFQERKMAEEKLRLTLTELEKSNIELHSLSLKDELTGLYNRRGISILGEQHFQVAKRNGGRFLLIFADMDGLKQINDSYGHNEGDFALKTAADILRKNFRQSDIIGRFGGDEFTIIATDSVKEDINFIKKRINDMLRTLNKNLDKPFRISLSFGFSIFDLQNNTKSFTEMITEADKMLYREKKKKKG